MAGCPGESLRILGGDREFLRFGVSLVERNFEGQKERAHVRLVWSHGTVSGYTVVSGPVCLCVSCTVPIGEAKTDASSCGGAVENVGGVLRSSVG